MRRVRATGWAAPADRRLPAVQPTAATTTIPTTTLESRETQLWTVTNTPDPWPFGRSRKWVLTSWPFLCDQVREGIFTTPGRICITQRLHFLVAFEGVSLANH
jgi:hypothetical protein